jgi:hypothetical protein
VRIEHTHVYPHIRPVHLPTVDGYVFGKPAELYLPRQNLEHASSRDQRVPPVLQLPQRIAHLVYEEQPRPLAQSGVLQPYTVQLDEVVIRTRASASNL